MLCKCRCNFYYKLFRWFKNIDSSYIFYNKAAAIGIQVTDLQVNTGDIGRMHIWKCSMSRINDMNRYADYVGTRYEEACGHNYDRLQPPFYKGKQTVK